MAQPVIRLLAFLRSLQAGRQAESRRTMRVEHSGCREVAATAVWFVVQPATSNAKPRRHQSIHSREHAVFLPFQPTVEGRLVQGPDTVRTDHVRVFHTSLDFATRFLCCGGGFISCCLLVLFVSRCWCIGGSLSRCIARTFGFRGFRSTAFHFAVQ